MKLYTFLSALLFVNISVFAQISKLEFGNVNHFKNVENDECRMDSLYYYKYNSTDNNYTLWIKKGYIYDINGNLIMQTSLLLDEISNLSKYEFLYDINNILIQYNYYYCIYDTCLISAKTEYYYDSINNNRLEYHYFFDDTYNNWNLNEIYLYENSYDEFGNLKVEISSIFNFQTNVWNKKNKREFLYDTNGNLNQYFIYYWGSNWNNSVKRDVFYDNKGIKNMILAYNWVASKNDWILSFKELYKWSCPSSTNSIPTAESFKIFPNPTTKNINISVPKTEKPTNVEILNLNGQCVYKQEINSENANISLPNLNKGLYLVKFTNEELVKTEKLLVE
jgi:hypothetical protein